MPHFHPSQREIYNLHTLLENGVAFASDMSPGTRGTKVVELVTEAIKAYYPDNPRVPGLVNDLIKQHLMMRIDDIFRTITVTAQITKEEGENPEKIMNRLEKEGLAIRNPYAKD